MKQRHNSSEHLNLPLSTNPLHLIQPHTDPTTVRPTLLRIAIIPRIIHAHLPATARKARKAAAQLVFDTDAEGIARGAAAGVARVLDAGVAVFALVIVPAATAADGVRGSGVFGRLGLGCRSHGFGFGGFGGGDGFFGEGRAGLVRGLRATTLFVAALCVIIAAVAGLGPHLDAEHLLAFTGRCRGRRRRLRRADLVGWLVLGADFLTLLLPGIQAFAEFGGIIAGTLDLRTCAKVRRFELGQSKCTKQGRQQDEYRLHD